MKESLINLTSAMPDWLGAMLLSMIPVTELRAAIPVSIGYGMNPIEAWALCCIGNIIPVPFIILFIRPVFEWMRKFKIFKGFVEKIEAKGNSKKEQVLKYEFWGLMLFVAIPLPGTGAWTGAFIASLLDMRLKDALPSIMLGVVTAGVLVTLASLGLFKILGF